MKLQFIHHVGIVKRVFNMHKINLDGQQLISYPMLNDEEFYEQN